MSMMSSINLKIFMSNSSQISFSEIDEYMRLYFSYIASLVTILICDDIDGNDVGTFV